MTYQDDQNDAMFPTPGMMFAGAAGFTGAGLFGRYLKNRETDIYAKLDAYAWLKNKQWYQKMRNAPMQSARQRWGTYLGFEMKEGTGRWKRYPHQEDISMFMPFRTREMNSLDRAMAWRPWRSGEKLAGKSRVLRASGMLAFGLMNLNSNMDQYGLKGIPISAAQETAGAAGGFVGRLIGGSAFHNLSGGWRYGAKIGSFAGMAMGAVAGYAAVEGLMKLSKLGRRWSTPELGGNFQDSADAMTMRQRSLNAIRTSQFNLRSELGREALHFSGLY